MTIRVHELRLSSIWVEPLPCLVPSDAPMAFLGDPILYGHEFEKARSGSCDWKLPWPKPEGHNFWEHYLGRSALAGIGSYKAWQHLVPFWLPSLCKAGLQSPVSHMRVEGFHYPSCIAVIITPVIKGDLPLEETVEAAFDVFLNRRYAIQWSGESTSSSDLLLKEIAAEGLNRLRKAALGDGALRKTVPKNPFTITTAIDGEVDNLEAENPSNGDLHRALEALCRWHRLWRANPLHFLDESTCYRFKDKDYTLPSHLLYGLERGRAVWFPGYFLKHSGEKIRTLGCYHRNLTLVTLQTGGLISVVELAAGFIKGGGTMSPTLQGLARTAVGRLAHVYGGVREKTYRSYSPYRQIKDEGAVEVIDIVRDHFGLPKLTP